MQEKNEDGEIIVEIKSKKIKGYLTDLRDAFIKNYEMLLGFEEFFKRLSKTYDMDLTYRINLWITEHKENINYFNNTLSNALKIEIPYSPQANKKKHYKDNELFIDTEKIKPDGGRVEPAVKEVSELLGDAF